MLFRPGPARNLEAVGTLLAAWNGEADQFRLAAIAARNGESPDALTVAAAEQAQEGLAALLTEIEGALDTLPSGDAAFPFLLAARASAEALLESVGTSYEQLDRFETQPVAGPRRIAHELLVAAKQGEADQSLARST